MGRDARRGDVRRSICSLGERARCTSVERERNRNDGVVRGGGGGDKEGLAAARMSLADVLVERYAC